jgi:hypothetical protein
VPMATVDMSPSGVYFVIVCAGTLWVAFDARRFDWHTNGFCDQVWKWIVGAATDGTVFRVFGGPVPGSAKVAAGLMAAGRSDRRRQVRDLRPRREEGVGGLFAQQGISIGYLDTRQMGVFVHHFGSLVRPIYGLWILLAFAAAVRVAQGRTRTARRHAP